MSIPTTSPSGVPQDQMNLSRGVGSRPGYVTVIGVSYIILGALGLIYSGLSIAGSGMVLLNQGDSGFGQAMTVAGPVNFPHVMTNIGLNLLGFFLSGATLVYSMFLLQDKETGRATLVALSIFSALFVLIRLVANVALTIFSPLQATGGMDPDLFLASQFIGMGIAALVSLAFAGFYFYNSKYLQKDFVVNFFNRSTH